MNEFRSLYNTPNTETFEPIWKVFVTSKTDAGFILLNGGRVIIGSIHLREAKKFIDKSVHKSEISLGDFIITYWDNDAYLMVSYTPKKYLGYKTKVPWEIIYKLSLDADLIYQKFLDEV